jgi:hypothetical protein
MICVAGSWVDEMDEAIRLAQRAFDERDCSLIVHMTTWRHSVRLYADPRFLDLRRQVLASD